MTEKATGAGFSLALLFYLTSAEPVGANVYVPDVPPHRFHEKVPEFVLI
jgi:hypothetical protein